MANKAQPSQSTRFHGSDNKDKHWGDAFKDHPNGSPVLNVHTADIHTELVNIHFSRDLGNADPIASAVTAGDSVISVTDSTKFAPLDRVTVAEDSVKESNTIIVRASSGAPLHQLTLDRPIENNYTTAALVREISTDLSLGNGTIASPVIYQIAPPVSEVWHIKTLSLTMVDGANPAIELFSGITALLNGLVIRSEGTTKRNLINIKKNEDLREYFGGTEIDIQQKTAGGDWMITGLWKIADHYGAIVRLDGAAGDSLQAIIQDNLTAITDIELVAQGHLEVS
jgi:hypothetical protein